MWCTSVRLRGQRRGRARGSRRRADAPRRDRRAADGEGAHARPARASPASPKFLGVEPTRLLKCIVFDVDGELGLALVPGDREVNEFALAAALAPEDGAPVRPTPTSTRIPSCRRATSARTSPGVDVVVADPSVARADRLGHRRERDRPPRAQRGARPRLRRRRLGRSRRRSCSGDACPRCGQPLSVDRGIEVGHVFQLGTKYSEALDAHYTDEDGAQHPMVMGCYGIGVSRDRRRGRRGAPRRARARVAGGARALRRAPRRAARPGRRGGRACIAARRPRSTTSCERAGLDVLYDDRDASPGVKFADADLLGMPVQLVVGAQGSRRGRRRTQGPGDRRARRATRRRGRRLVSRSRADTVTVSSGSPRPARGRERRSVTSRVTTPTAIDTTANPHSGPMSRSVLSASMKMAPASVNARPNTSAARSSGVLLHRTLRGTGISRAVRRRSG